jgi:hypothetical protein
MKQITRYAWSTLLAGTLLAGFALASDKKPDPKMEEMMKKMEAAGTPGPAHKALDSLVGDWNAEVKMWMDPSAPPNVTKATAKNTWVMGNRFVQQDFKGEFMGKPFRGMSLTGYDNMKKSYSNVWIDDMSTGMFNAEGKTQDGGKVITFEGTYACPETGELNKPSKQVYRILSRDKHVFEMHDPSKGANTKTMEITYTRK